MHKITKGGLYGLVNNAGVVIPGPLEMLNADSIKVQINVNLTGTIMVTHAFLPLLKQAKGRIVNMGSIAGRVVMPGLSIYGSTKLALRGFSDAMRVELKDSSIQVSLIEPGKIDTRMWERCKQVHIDNISKSNNSASFAQHLKLHEAQLQFSTKDAGAPVKLVCDAVYHALSSKRPKHNYLVGKSAKERSVLSFLPAPIRDESSTDICLSEPHHRPC